jgi:hypothetical protein
MCSWERFCIFAREPERRTVGSDAQVSVHGTRYQVDEELVGQAVVLWWGLFDDELFVERGGQKYGPYRPVGGPIPLIAIERFGKPRRSGGPSGSKPSPSPWRSRRTCLSSRFGIPIPLMS